MIPQTSAGIRGFRKIERNRTSPFQLSGAQKGGEIVKIAEERDEHGPSKDGRPNTRYDIVMADRSYGTEDERARRKAKPLQGLWVAECDHGSTLVGRCNRQLFIGRFMIGLEQAPLIGFAAAQL